MEQRFQAYEIFNSIVRQGKYSNLAVKELLKGGQEEKRLVHAMVMGTLEKLIYIDYIIKAYARGRVRPVVPGYLKAGGISAAFYECSALCALFSMGRAGR